MAQVSITQLPDAQALTGAESVPIVQNGVTVQTTTGAIAGAGALNYPFLTVSSTIGLTEARYVTVGSGLTTTDNGAGSTFQISLTGTVPSLNSLGNGFVVKTGTDTLTNRSITVGGGMTVSNGDGIAGNPVIGLDTTLQNLSAMSGIGLMTIDGTTFSQVTLSGTASQISVSNGTGVGGNPTVGLASNAVLPGTGGVQIPSGTSVQRLANNGVIRYNTDTTRFEGYQAGAWIDFGLGDGTVTSVTGVAHQISVTSGTTTPIIGLATNPTVPGTGSMVIPSGTTAERNALAFGAIRYNTDTQGLEAYTQATGWGAIISGSGVSTFSGGSTGLTPASPTSGGIILAGILNPASGGTGINNGSYTITLGGNVSLGGTLITAGNFTTSGAFGITLTATGTTSVTLPTTGTLATLAGSEILTNKTMSGSSNTFTNIPNSALVNNSVTYNGVTVALGGSGTITATATNPLTVSTGLQLNSGTTYDGSAAKTISIDSTVATLTGSQILTNKTMSGASNTFTNIPNSALTNSSVTIGSDSLSLGGTLSTLHGVSISGSDNTLSNIANSSLTNSSIAFTYSGGISGSASVSLGGTNALSLSNIPNSSLTNSSVTIGTTTISLGGTSLTLGGLTSVTVTQDPTADLQLATKQYVDTVAQGLNVKASVLWGTTGNITLSGLTTQAGGEWTGSLTAGDRILVKNQLTAADNGIYAAASSGWTRTADANSWNELVSAFVFVQDGATLADTGWVCTVNPGGTLGVTAVTWTQFSGAGTYTAGTGLTLTGTQFSLTNPVAVNLGGTSYASYTTGDMLYASGSTALSKLGIGSNTYIMTSSGSAPQWSAPSGITVGTATKATNVAGGTTGAIPYNTAADTTTFLSLGTTNYVLTAGASAPQYVAQSTLSVGNATNAANVGVTLNTTDTTDYLAFVSATTGNNPVLVNSSVTVNASTGKITGGIAGGAF